MPPRRWFKPWKNDHVGVTRATGHRTADQSRGAGAALRGRARAEPDPRVLFLGLKLGFYVLRFREKKKLTNLASNLGQFKNERSSTKYEKLR